MARRSGGGDFEERQMRQRRKKEFWREGMKELQNTVSLQQCTFHPIINS